MDVAVFDQERIHALYAFPGPPRAKPGRLVETFLVKSWAEHMRQHQRVTQTRPTIAEARK
jgi:Transmembrane secretion effector